MSAAGRLAGKVALVTGAGNGIGKGCALIFARSGATVIGCDRDRDALEATVTEARAAGVTIEAEAGIDLVDERSVDSLMRRVGDRHGRLDVLVNAAAFAAFRWLEEMSVEDWRRTLSGELDIVFLAVRAAWPLLRASAAASIINFASANARHALDGSPALAHCAGKGGVLAMTRQLAMEGAAHNIRANTISPGFIRTAATAAHLAADPGFERQVLAKNMLKRLGEPEDVAWCATWLASDEARYVTGADIAVDAGATAW
jgi:NAD(P)-dependent dehydrogenase (short-subunit alcohol dehydrogenase family)